MYVLRFRRIFPVLLMPLLAALLLAACGSGNNANTSASPTAAAEQASPAASSPSPSPAATQPAAEAATRSYDIWANYNPFTLDRHLDAMAEWLMARG